MAFIGGPTYGTALPGSPIDGHLHVLTDSTSVPTYQWKFRYNASSANTEKWEFTGGTSLEGFAATPTVSAGSAVFAAITGTPSIAIPRAGIYDVEVGGDLYLARANVAIYVAPNGAGLTASTANSIFISNLGGGDNPSGSVTDVMSVNGRKRLVRSSLTAATMTLQARWDNPGASGAATYSYSNLLIAVTPVRIQ